VQAQVQAVRGADGMLRGHLVRWLPQTQIIHWDCPLCSVRFSYPEEGMLAEVAEINIRYHLQDHGVLEQARGVH